MKRIKVAMLVPDNREEFRRYDDPQPEFGMAVAALLEGMKDLPGLEVHVVSCTQQPLASPERLAENIHYHSVLVPKWGWLRTGYLGCRRAIRRKLRELRPHLVHGQGTERYCALAAALSGFPNVVTIHGNMRGVARGLGARPFSFHWFTARLEAYALRRAGGVICNSAYTENEVRTLARRRWRVPNALRREFLAAAPASREPAGLPRLLSVGNILPYKRQLEVLDVCARLHQQGLRFEMQFIGHPGTGQYGREFTARLREAERAGYARHVGFKSAAELVRCLDLASALVHFPTEEAFGLVVAEALSRNLKVFAARTGGIADAAAGVEGVELLAENDWKGLESAILRWAAAGCPQPNSAAAVLARYHPRAIAQRHLEVYASCLPESA
jgi:glycosyltransferase involved in cell wall biosynthesis